MVICAAKLNEIKKTLAGAGVFDPAFEAAEIVREYAGSAFAADRQRELSDAQIALIDGAVARRVTGEPLQYIFGQWEFYGFPFYVGEGVLIPRPETELLVDIAVGRLHKGSRLLDLFSGTGCVPVSAALKTGAECYAVELYEAAFSYLERNIALNGARVTAVRADACDGTLLGDMRFDMITANPPYLTADEMRELMREVAYEPETALAGGDDGLYFYRRLIPAWAGRLADGGIMAVEIGETQGDEVAEMMSGCGLKPHIIKDPAGFDRVVTGELA